MLEKNIVETTTSLDNVFDSVCISDFRFRKDNLQKIADGLWPLMNVYLLGEKDDIKVENGYQTTYETGFLVVLYRMSYYPRRVRPDMEIFLHAKIKAVRHFKHISDSVLQSNASIPIQSGFIF
jgi:hypothetical protein